MKLVPLPFVVPFVLLIFGCGASQTPDPETARSAASQPATHTEAPEKGTAKEAAAPVAEIGKEILSTIIVESFDQILNQGMGYIYPHLPPPLRAVIQPAMIKRHIFKSLKSPSLEHAFDMKRKIAIAVADPITYQGGGLGPFILGLPVKNMDLLIAQMDRNAQRHESTPYGDHQFFTGSASFWVRYHQSGYALVTSHEKLLYGAANVLIPLVSSSLKSTARMHIDISKVIARYGDKYQLILKQLQLNAVNAKPGAAVVVKNVLKWVTYLNDMRSIVLDLNLGSTTIDLTASLLAKKTGKLLSEMKSWNQGSTWGAKYLPASCAGAVLLRSTPKSWVDDMVMMSSILEQDNIPTKLFDKAFEAYRQSVKLLSGEIAIGTWVDADGGINIAIAQRATDAAKYRLAIQKANQMLVRNLDFLFSKRDFEGTKFKFKFRKGALRIAGQRADLTEVMIRWPRGKTKQEREAQKKIRQGITKIMGKRLKVAHIVLGDASLYVIGKSYRRQLAKMIAIAQGKGSKGLEPVINKHIKNKPIITYVYVALVRMMEQIMRTVEQFRPIPADIKSVYRQTVPPSSTGHEVPLTALLSVNGAEVVLKTEFPVELIGYIAKATVATLKKKGMGSPRRVP